jgi:hypothetical protein
VAAEVAVTGIPAVAVADPRSPPAQRPIKVESQNAYLN